MAAACLFLLLIQCFCATAAWLQSSAGSQGIQGANITTIHVCLFHMAVIQEVCQRYGGR